MTLSDVIQQLDLFAGQKDAPLTKRQRRIMERLDRSGRIRRGIPFHALRDELRIEWEALGRDLQALLARGLIWHNHYNEYGVVRDGVHYSSTWLADDAQHLVSQESDVWEMLQDGFVVYTVCAANEIEARANIEIQMHDVRKYKNVVLDYWRDSGKPVRKRMAVGS